MQPSTRWAQGAYSTGVKRPASEADHLSPSVEVKIEWRYIFMDADN